MRVLFLGTGAAEGYPAIFCECAHCTTARARGGRNLRRRSALLVNDDLLIDMGPDLVASMHATGANLGRVATMLITHSPRRSLPPSQSLHASEQFLRHDTRADGCLWHSSHNGSD